MTSKTRHHAFGSSSHARSSQLATPALAHEQVDRSDLALDRGDRALDLIAAGHVTREGEGPGSARGGFDLLGRPGRHGGARARLGELERDRAPDAAAPAGDQRGALQHRPTLSGD